MVDVLTGGGCLVPYLFCTYDATLGAIGAAQHAPVEARHVMTLARVRGPRIHTGTMTSAFCAAAPPSDPAGRPGRRRRRLPHHRSVRPEGPGAQSLTRCDRSGARRDRREARRDRLAMRGRTFRWHTVAAAQWGVRHTCPCLGSLK